MVKVLFCGNLRSEDDWSRLVTRLQELQTSQHGPFGVLFLTGSIFAAPKDEVLQQLPALEIKIYAFMIPPMSPDKVEAYNQIVETLPMVSQGIINAQGTLTVAFYRDRFGSASVSIAIALARLLILS